MNFHGYIAVPLEAILRRVFGFSDRPLGTVFDADAIESGFFYDAMCLILCKNNIENWYEFADKYIEMKNKPGNEIGIEKAISVFKEFEELIG